MQNFFRRYWAVLLWASLILVVSIIPNNTMPTKNWFDEISMDKIGHLVVYWLLTWLLIWSFRQKNKDIQQVYTKALLISICYGICMELLQLLIFVSRTFEFLDIIANISGSFLGFLSFKYVVGKRLKNEWI